MTCRTNAVARLCRLWPAGHDGIGSAVRDREGGPLAGSQGENYAGFGRGFAVFLAVGCQPPAEPRRAKAARRRRRRGLPAAVTRRRAVLFAARLRLASHAQVLLRLPLLTPPPPPFGSPPAGPSSHSRFYVFSRWDAFGLRPSCHWSPYSPRAGGRRPSGPRVFH